MTKNPAADKLAQKICSATIDARVDPDTIFMALRLATTFWMSLVCSTCREDIARKLTAEIPAMLEAANQVAKSGDPLIARQ